MTRARPVHPRGLAMLLVLVCLATATILASSYLASRDNSGALGSNVAEGARARWAATTGVGLAVATFETEVDWRGAAADGVLLDAHPLASDAAVTVRVTDAVTGEPATDVTNVVRVVSEATSGTISQVREAVVEVTSLQEQQGVADVGLGEFAAVANGRMRISDRATVARWATAPRSRIGEPVHVASLDGTAGAIDLQGDAAALDVMAWRAPGSSDAVLSNGTGVAVGLTELPVLPPIPGSPEPEPRRPLVTDLFAIVTLTSGSVISSDLRLGELGTAAGAVWQLADGVTTVVNHDALLRSGSRLVVNGNATLVLWEDLVMEPGSTIEVVDGGSLELFIGGALRMTDAYVGDFPADAGSWTATGKSRFMTPERIRIWSNDHDGGGNWDVGGGSVVKAVLHAPDAGRVRLEDTSAFYGRLTAAQVELADDAALFYDPGLNEGSGFTDLSGELYEGGKLKPQYAALLSLSSYDDATLAAAADSVGTDLRLPGTHVESATDDDTSTVKPWTGDDVTPRVWPVASVTKTHGWKRDDWESSIKGDDG